MKKIIILLVVLCIVFISCSSINTPSVVTVEGSLHMVGSVPFNHLVITTVEGVSYEVDTPSIYSAYTDGVSYIKVTGNTYTEKLVSVSGAVIIYVHYITNITFVKVLY